MSVTIIRVKKKNEKSGVPIFGSSQFVKKPLIIIMAFLFCSFLVFGTAAVIKHLVTELSIEPSVQVSTNIPDTLSSPAGNDYSFWFNITNKVSRSTNYTVMFFVDDCVNDFFKIVYHEGVGFCELNTTFEMPGESTFSDVFYIQSNTSTPSGDYTVHFKVLNDDFRFVI